MLLKLIAVDSYHFIRYKCKITHCPDSQTSEYISAIVLDDNEKLSTSEVLNVTFGSGTFNQYKQFWYTKSPICYNERIQKVCTTRFLFIYFLLSSSKVSTFCQNWKLLHTRRCLQEKWASVSVHSAGVSGLEKLCAPCRQGVQNL